MDVYLHRQIDEMMQLFKLMDDIDYISKWSGNLGQELRQHEQYNPIWTHAECMERVNRSLRYKDMTLIERKIEAEKYFISLIDNQIKAEKDKNQRNRLFNIVKASEEYTKLLKSLAGIYK